MDRHAILRWWRADQQVRDATAVASIFLVGVVLNLVGLTSVLAGPWLGGEPFWWHTGLLAIGCASMVVRRRHPALGLVIGLLAVLADLAVGGSVAMVLVLFDLLFVAALHGSSRMRTAVTAGVATTVTAAVVAAAVLLRDLRATVFVALQFTGLLVVPLWWAANVREQRLLGEAAAAQARRDAVTAERASMARELHDVVASHLSTTAIHSAAALALPPETERDRAALAAVRASSLAALDEMRTMITVLRAGGDDALVPAGLAQLPQALAAARDGGLEVDADIRAVELAPTVDQAAYRVISEALTNARKHAPGSRVAVRVGPAGGWLHITVTNTLAERGRSGAAAGLGLGAGLPSMAERAALAGGALRAGRDGDLWRVHATLPLPGSAR